jgi:GTP-binding protein
LDIILEVEETRHRRIPTAEVNEALERVMRHQPPPHHRGRAVKLKYATQVSVAPPTITIFCNFPKAVPEHYIRYIRNTFRSQWGFIGTPLRIRLRESRESRS